MRALFASHDAFSALFVSCIQPQLQVTVLPPGILHESLVSASPNMSQKQPAPDWRSPAGYAYLNDLDLAGFAWEFLRRNPDYQRNFRSVVGKPKSHTKFAQRSMTRWGLRFPSRSGSARRHRAPDLAAAA